MDYFLTRIHDMDHGFLFLIETVVLGLNSSKAGIDFFSGIDFEFVAPFGELRLKITHEIKKCNLTLK